MLTRLAVRPMLISGSLLAVAVLSGCGNGTGSPAESSAGSGASTSSSGSATPSGPTSGAGDEAASTDPGSTTSASTTTGSNGPESPGTGSSRTATGSATGGSTVPASFSAVGNEPFWSVTVDGSTLLLARPSEQDVRAETRRGEEGGATRYTATVNGRPLTLTVTPGSCGDGMSDETYPYTAELNLAGETSKGCAKA